MRIAKLISSVSVLTLFFCTQAVFAAEKFPDVPEGHKNAAAIQNLKDAGIIGGYKDGTYQPDKSISRAETTAVILKAAGINAAKSDFKLPFTDVPEDAWYFPMIQKGVEMGKIKGYLDDTFRPENPVTLPEALALMTAFFQIDVSKIQTDSRIYEGLNSKAWYSKYMQYAKDKFLIEPGADGTVDHAANISRGELAELIYRQRIVNETGKPFDITADWITTEHLDNFWKLRHPADWEIFKGLQNSVLWKRAEGQVFLTRMWPKSARLSVSLVENPRNLTAAQHFAETKKLYKDSYPKLEIIHTELSLANLPVLKTEILEKGIIDFTLQLPNKKFLVFYGEYGEAAIGEFWRKKIELIALSYQYVERPPEPPKPVIPLEQRMEMLRENILISEKWSEISELFPDKQLIHTDAIGIGTGPVDYYFSAEASHTIKLERSSGTVLNIKEGRTSAF